MASLYRNRGAAPLAQALQRPSAEVFPMLTVIRDVWAAFSLPAAPEWPSPASIFTTLATEESLRRAHRGALAVARRRAEETTRTAPTRRYSDEPTRPAPAAPVDPVSEVFRL